MFLRRSIATVVLIAAAVVTASVQPAAAQDRIAPFATAPVFHRASEQTRTAALATTNLTYKYWGAWVYGAYTVDIWWGYDYSPTTNNLRAWAKMDGGSSSAIHLQFEPLNLGDRNGVLASKTANSQNGVLEAETGAVSCHYPNGVYRSNLHYSIRWPDGTLTSKQQTGTFEASASLICT